MEEQNLTNYGAPVRTRPTGVTVLAALYIVGGLIMLAMPLIMTALFVMIGMAGNGVGGLAVAGITCWIVFGIIALICFAIAYGLLKGQGWARIVAIIFAILGLLNIPIGTIISIIILWYLFKPEVKAWFQ